MKRLILTVMAVLSMTMTFAGEGKVVDSKENSTHTASSTMASITNTDAYDMSYNIRRLGATLGLTTNQMETIKLLNRTFRADMMSAASAGETERKALLNSAVEKDLKYMSYVLTPEQYNKYQTLLNTTLANRGLEK